MCMYVNFIYSRHPSTKFTINTGKKIKTNIIKRVTQFSEPGPPLKQTSQFDLTIHYNNFESPIIKKYHFSTAVNYYILCTHNYSIPPIIIIFQRIDKKITDFIQSRFS